MRFYKEDIFLKSYKKNTKEIPREFSYICTRATIIDFYYRAYFI